MNEFFEALKNGKSYEEAITIFKNRILRKKLGLIEAGKSYTDLKNELDDLLNLAEKERILKKICEF